MGLRLLLLTLRRRSMPLVLLVLCPLMLMARPSLLFRLSHLLLLLPAVPREQQRLHQRHGLQLAEVPQRRRHLGRAPTGQEHVAPAENGRGVTP